VTSKALPSLVVSLFNKRQLCLKNRHYTSPQRLCADGRLSGHNRERSGFVAAWHLWLLVATNHIGDSKRAWPRGAEMLYGFETEGLIGARLADRVAEGLDDSRNLRNLDARVAQLICATFSEVPAFT
jgi:hypothetical protein